MAGRKRAQDEVNLQECLGARGLHFTRQRVAVYEYLRRVNHHPTADEIFAAVRQDLPQIGRATVYKNLEALVDCGVVSKLSYGDSAARYEVRTDHHYHARCFECGSVADLDPQQGSKWLKRVRPHAGFEVTDYRLELIGVCARCRASAKSGRGKADT